MAELYIEDVHTPTNSEWDSIWQKCDYASYYHSREWAEIWKVYSGGKIYPEPKLIIFNDGKKALIPLSVQSSLGLLRSYISSPAGTFGGWISSDKLLAAHANLLLDHLAGEYPNLVLFMNPYDKLVFEQALPSNDETYAIDLGCGHDAAYKKWHKSQREKVKKAIKLGVLIREAASAEDWAVYYDIYEDSLRRWGKNATTNYGKELFEELFRRQSPYIKLWLAEFENKIIAGNIAFYSNKQVAGWHAAALEKYFKTRMVNLIIYKIFEHACKHGYSWLDFGPCGGHEGVRAFKKEFGTEELSFPIINAETPLKKIFNKVHSLKNKAVLL